MRLKKSKKTFNLFFINLNEPSQIERVVYDCELLINVEEDEGNKT
jgi:hypothetical protein